MKIYGSNILNQAMRYVSTSLIKYYQFKRNHIDPSGVKLPIYAPAVTLKASVQAIPKDKYQAQGLDFKSNYINVLCCVNAQSVNRGRSNDRIEFNGQCYDVIAVSDWFVQDGWVRMTCVYSNNENALYECNDRQ